MFVNEPVAIGYNTVKYSSYDNLGFEQKGYNKRFCVDCFLNEMLQIERYKKKYFKNLIEINPRTIPKTYDESTSWLCERAFKSTTRCPKSKDEDLPICEEEKIVEDQCPLTCKFR